MKSIDHSNRTVFVSRHAHQRGFTLLETMIAVSLTSLLFLGTMNLFITTTQTAMRTGVQNQSNLDASNGMQFVLNNAREAYDYRLPGDTTTNPSFTVPTGSLANFQTTLTTGTVVKTCVELIFPATTTASIQRASATDVISQSVYSQSAGNILWIYRSAAKGVPDPANGKFLWAQGKRGDGTSINQAIARSVLQALAGPTAATPIVSADQAAQAVQFAHTTGTASVTANELSFKLVSGDFSPLTGTQTNEASDGSNITQLTGKCSLMRNSTGTQE